MKKTILSLLSALSLFASAMADGYRNVQYYSGASTVRWSLLTHLVYFDTSVIDENGAFIPHTAGEIADIQDLQQQAAEHGKVLMVCYGGSFSFDGPFKAMLEDSVKRAAFIQAIADNVTTLNLTGVDLDWEYPSNAYEFSLMDTFYTEIRAAIGPEPLLTAAVAGWQVQLSANTVNESLDWIQTMAYYWRTASQSADDLGRWTGAGVSKGKINLGVPFAGNSHDATVPWDIPYYQFIDSIVPFDPSVNDVYFAPYEGTFNFVGVNLQKEKMRVAAAGGNGTMVWHHRTDVEDPDRSLAVSLHDESVRHHAVIDDFELPVGVSANHLYQPVGPAVTGSYTRVSGFTGAEATLTYSGAQWSQSNITSLEHPTGYAFPTGSQIRFDYKVLDAHADVSFYLRLLDGEGDWIQQGHWTGLSSTGWHRAEYDRGGFSTNVDFNENDVRKFQILTQYGGATTSPFTSRVVFDNLVMIAPDPAQRPIQDRDADGFADRLETTMGTSAIDPSEKPPAPLEGLRSWWTFDDNFSLLVEEEIQQVHGKVYGATWAEGRSGHALALDGTDDRIVMDSTAALSGTTPFSLSAWVKTTDTDGGMILQQRDSVSTAGQYRLRCNPDGTVNFSIHNGGYQFDFASTNSINDGNWHYVVATRNGTEGSIYIDGALDGQDSGPLTALEEHAVAAGYNHRDNNDHLAGTLDDIRIFTRALSAFDITCLYTDTDTDTLNDDWEIAQYGNPAAHSSADNPEGDTLDMFAEMAFGGNALAFDATGSFSSASITNNAGTPGVAFSYRRTKNHGPYRINYQVQSRDALDSGAWVDALPPSAYVIDDPDGVTEWATHIIPIPTDSNQRFFRAIATPK